MDAPVEGDQLVFGEFRLEPRASRLSRRNAVGDWVAVPLGSRALEILRVLLASPGVVVSKDTIMDAVWPGIAVEPKNLTVQMTALRRVLDQGRAGESCIQIVPGRGYRLVLDVTRAAEQAPPEPATAHPDALPARPTRRWRIAAAAVAIVALLLVAAWQAGWFAAAPTAPRLSIVVLPFQNLSGDPNDDYLAEGITDDLTTELSNLAGAFVIARSSADTYRGKPVNVQHVGHDLGVRYVLEGSMRRLGDVLRLNVQLVSAESGSHVWAGALDEPVNDLAAGQREQSGARRRLRADLR